MALTLPEIVVRNPVVDGGRGSQDGDSLRHLKLIVD